MRRLIDVLGTILVLALVGGGCGGDGGGGSEVDGGSGDASTSGPPKILEITPADGAAGVLVDAPIVIRFDRPMDPGTVVDALDSADLDFSMATVTWNGTYDTVTLDVSDQLEYAAGIDPAEVVANAYTFGVLATAEDADGTALDEGAEVTFHTARLINVSAPYEAANSGIATSDGTVAQTLFVGDNSLDYTARTFLTFDLSDVADRPVLGVVDGTLSVRVLSTTGDPWALGGTLYIEHVSYGDLDSADYGTNTLAVLAQETNDMAVSFSADTSDAVLDDLAERIARGDRSQYRFRFSVETNENSMDDFLSLNAESATLSFDYLIE